MDPRALECAEYFHKRPGYRRMMDEILSKYKGLGRVGGSVCLRDASEEEFDAARSFFGRSFDPPLKFNVADFQLALQNTRYSGIDLPTLLEAYFGEPIKTKRELQRQKEESLSGIIETAMAGTKSQLCRRWLRALRERREPGYSLLRQNMEAGDAAGLLGNVCACVEYLEENPGQPVRLAVISARVTWDPHSFDSNTAQGKMLLYLLAFRLGSPLPKNAQERDELYYENGILCDSISSTVTQVGLVIYSGEQEHLAYRAFRQGNECSTINSNNLSKVTGISSPSGRVYIVENQMLFSQMCDQAESFRSPLICSSGQLQVAVLRVLDMLAESGSDFYYSGDFDYGGLSIAAGLIDRYGERLHLWHMSPGDYNSCRSDHKISAGRLSLFHNFSGTPLAETAKGIQSAGYAGYQELLLPALLGDLAT